MDTVPEYMRPKLTPDQQYQAVGMLRRGDRQMDVALWFMVSPSTVNKIWKKRGKIETPDAPLPLPPAGPYVILARTELTTLEKRSLASEAIVDELRSLLTKYEAGVSPKPQSANLCTN